MSQQEQKEQAQAQNPPVAPTPPQTQPVAQQEPVVVAQEQPQPKQDNFLDEDMFSSVWTCESKPSSIFIKNSYFRVQEPPKSEQKAQVQLEDEKKEQKPQQEAQKPEILYVPSNSQQKMSSSVQEQNGRENEAKSEKQEEEDDPGKSQRKGSSEQIQESREEENENDTSQPAASGGKKCFNKLCTSKKIYKKIRSKVEVARYRFLCKNCYENYVNNNFCEFCEQIYSNFDEDEDQDKWVGCDQCERWNHVECQRKFRNPNYVFNRQAVDEPYQCLACSRKNKNIQSEVPKKKIPENREIEPPRPRVVPKPQINKEQKISIFHKKPETFPCLEPFLQSFNFRLWLNQSLIREDIQTLRSLARRPLGQEEPKKGTKKIKMDC